MPSLEVQTRSGDVPKLIVRSNDQRKARNYKRIRAFAIIMFALLLVQLMLGMWTNLFATFPSRSPSVNPLDSVFVDGPYILASHIVNGIALGILSILVIVLSALTRNTRTLLLSCAGFGSILLAGESGIIFALGWYSNDYLSFLMSVGYVLSLAIYFYFVTSHLALKSDSE